MSEPEFDLYLSLLSKFLRLNAAQKAEISDELRAHLEDRLADLTAEGRSRDEAIRLALEEFGDAGALAWQFTLPHHIRRRRQIMRYSLGSFAALAGIFMLVSLNWPARPDLAPAPQTVAAQAAPEGVTANDAGQDAAQDSDTLRRQIELKLESRDFELSFQETPLGDVVSYLSQLMNVDIIVPQSSYLQELVNLQTRKGALSARTALELILANTTGGELQIVIKDGIIVLTAGAEDYEVQVYDCRDLLAGVMVQSGGFGGGGMGGGGGGGGFFSVPPEMAALILNQFGGGAGGAVGGGQAQKPASDIVSTSTAGLMLIGVIRESTRPTTWAADGDPAGGSLSEFNGMLVVRHNQAVHRKIKDVLEKLRKAVNAQQLASLEQMKETPPLEIPPGKRLVTLRTQNWEVPVNAMKPGRRVDVVWYSETSGDAMILLSGAEIVLPNVTPLTAGGFATPTSMQVNSVSLIVTPEEAMKLQRAESAANPLKFLLRGDGDPAPVKDEQAPQSYQKPPSADEIMMALPDIGGGTSPLLAETSRDNVRINVEPIFDRIDECRLYPLVGRAKLHHLHYKCKVFYDKITRLKWPVPFSFKEEAEEVVHIDRDHLIQCAGIEASRR